MPARYILDEVVVPTTFDSNLDEAERILLEAVREVTAEMIAETGVEPFTKADLYDYGIMVRARYMMVAVERVRISYEIHRRAVKAFRESDKVDFAIPRVYSYKKALSGRRVTSHPG